MDGAARGDASARDDRCRESGIVAVRLQEHIAELDDRDRRGGVLREAARVSVGSWDPTLYGGDDALDARGELFAAVPLPDEPRLFAACVGLLALLEPDAPQFETIGEHAALEKLPPSLR